MVLPVSLDEARAQLRVEVGDHDEEISGFLHDAAAWVESYTGHILEAREVTEDFRCPARSVLLRAWPVANDAVPNVSYLSAAGEPATFAGVFLDVSRRPARISLASGAVWPSRDPNLAFTVTVRAGYETPEEVPRNFRRAMLVLIAAYDADREGGAILAQAETAATRLCRGYKVHRV